ncbi:sulfite exporter TauE/SafE family protein [Leptolyngbya sp. FACHB-321]|uniref:nickel/cobalt transporter n=1 Tax=Leptolyngbya sp. FACHB-321 TaxID=2692807 RepID=UPI0016871CC9|nr:sulfite exporter TauE/SafE family protein [Leptolyngbya sp. FACHB-321]MBD2036905.1 sulfite exporter TauE/SafE family protein [Leptolyngbya sp. FACHB-321]
MKTLLHHLTWMAALVVVSLAWEPAAAAHPLGNFTINHYAGLQIARDGVAIDYVLDMAEIPAFQERIKLDTPARLADYPMAKCQELKSDLHLRLNQHALPLALLQSTVAFPPGVGGLATLRLTCGFQAAVALAGADQQLAFDDQSYSQRLGWRELTVTADLPLQGEVTANSITQRLTDYPTELLSSPFNQRQLAFTVNPSQTSAQPLTPVPLKPANAFSQALSGRRNDAFTNLILSEELNFSTILVALAVAFVWGGLHALTPGHGKTIVGAYLVGARSQVQHALLLGLTVTLTHTAGIFTLGLVMLGSSRFLLTEQLFPWLSALSGVLVTVIGGKLLITRLRQLLLGQRWTSSQVADANQAHSHHHSHDASHSHSHDASHSHSHDHGLHSHSHLLPSADSSPITWSSLLALGVSGGLLPCPSALVVLLGAIAIGRIGFGLALVLAFSLGLAGVLTGIGVLLVYAKHWFERLPVQAPQSNLFPAVSALLMTLVGIGLTAQALLVPTL